MQTNHQFDSSPRNERTVLNDPPQINQHDLLQHAQQTPRVLLLGAATMSTILYSVILTQICFNIYIVVMLDRLSRERNP